MTSIIKLDSSPSQHRKHYSTYHPDRNNYQKLSNCTTTTGNVHVDGLSTWSNNRHRQSYDNGYKSYLSSNSSKQSDSIATHLTSPELSRNNIQKHYLINSHPTINDSNKMPFDGIDAVIEERTSSSLNPMETSNDHYYPISQCLSHSESNVSTSFQFSNRSCNKYGFFLDNNSEEDYETPSVQDLKEIRIKERKWLQMLNNWRYYINFKWDKIRDRCRKGIPHSLRSQAWFHLCGAHLQKNRFPNLYGELLEKNIPSDVQDDICKDLHRQFPNHEMFADPSGVGQTDLYNVLKAFAAYRPNMGYCQAQAPIAAVFLMHMPAERAFWCLVALSKYYISGYFMHNLEDIRIHGQMLVAFLKKYCPSAYNLLNRQNIEPEIYMTEWFMCIYSRNIPWPSVLRVWDMFLCEGLTILFKVGLYLVDIALKHETMKTCPTMYETCQKLRNIPKLLLTEDSLIRGIKRFELRDIDLLKEHKIQMKKFHKSKKQQK
ncbi:tbc1 domain family member 10a-like protein [Dermatophagoides farinae]|uniref:Tbc1 domain family member 10a-like protein n=1 Tax=Dermatophagoides farinae TaxID=6954 RepID=A0A9D4P931_DERFA|nr:TBC1 domain family member whacked-like [Dermatophagoides farinae]KAH7646141.1 tbc1 domain family member 10a-like protein [Dermatophagoides farinae]